MEHGGCVLHRRLGKTMNWKDTRPGQAWHHARLPVTGEFPAHPFLAPTVQEAIDDGSLTAWPSTRSCPYDP